MASARVAPLATPEPKANVGATGTAVSRVKVVVPALLALPAASVATALTLMVPLPRVVRSALVSVAGTGVLPLPVTVLLTVPPPLRLKVTTVLTPLSAVTVNTPVFCSASVLVAPLATPEPKANVGEAGASVSTTTCPITAAAVNFANPLSRLKLALLPPKSLMALVPGKLIMVPAAMPSRVSPSFTR